MKGVDVMTITSKQADRQIDRIVDSYGRSRDSLISILQDVQSRYRYLPEDALREIAVKLDLPLIQVYGVATFFKSFSLEPRGKHLVNVCLGTACHVRGANTVLDEVKRQLNVEPGQTTDDMEYTLETVNCLGACALGPVVVVDGEYHGQISPRKVKKVIGSRVKAARV
jgi:NADH:ubiquinone oxidoreductase subunit E